MIMRDGETGGGVTFNITDFLGREFLGELPLLCGVDPGRADYERFRAFCQSAERMPDAADRAWVCARLEDLLGHTVTVDAAHCDELWCEIAERSLFGGEDPTAPPRPVLPLPPLPRAEDEAVDCPPLADAASWGLWCERTKAALSGARAVRVVCPCDLTVKKPSLWQVERLLRGEVVDRDLAAAQQVDYLAGVCGAACRLRLDTACSAETVLALLEQTARRWGSLPPLVWNWDEAVAPSRDTLLAAARLVRAERGVQPILTNRIPSDAPLFADLQNSPDGGPHRPRSRRNWKD